VRLPVVCCQVDRPIIRNQIPSHKIIKITKQFRRRVLGALCDQDQYAIGSGLVQDEVNANNQLTVVRNPDGTTTAM